MSTWVYQTSRLPSPANWRIEFRYPNAVASTIFLRSLSLKLLSRAATSMLAASRLTSHSHGAGSVSSKSFTSNRSLRSGEANSPKLDRCASPQACTMIPVAGVCARSLAIGSAAPR